MKKTLVKLLALFGVVLLAASLTACDNGSSDDGDSEDSSYTATGTGTTDTSTAGGTTSSGSGSTSSKTVTTVFVKMDAGTFSMGCSADDYSDETVHSVTLTRDFWICDHEVTQAEYKAVMGTNPSFHTGDENRPVERVSWNDAIAYCNARSTNEGRTPCYTVSGSSVTCNFDANGYRLPTEAEWEYAARAGDTTTSARTWSGTSSESSLGNYAWYIANSRSTTHPVKDKQPNAKGLYDMSGNVNEWCWDWYGSYGSSAVTDPTGPSSGSTRVYRGGSSWYNAAYCAVSSRFDYNPGDRYSILGFRVCRSAQ